MTVNNHVLAQILVGTKTSLVRSRWLVQDQLLYGGFHTGLLIWASFVPFGFSAKLAHLSGPFLVVMYFSGKLCTQASSSVPAGPAGGTAAAVSAAAGSSLATAFDSSSAATGFSASVAGVSSPFKANLIDDDVA